MVQFNMGGVVYDSVLHRGNSGDGWLSVSTLFRY